MQTQIEMTHERDDEARLLARVYRLILTWSDDDETSDDEARESETSDDEK